MSITTPHSAASPWLSDTAARRIADITGSLDLADRVAVDRRLSALIGRNREIHDIECINLNPASNVMNPRAEAVLASGLTTRASLGHPGEKYEMGLEAIEEIEVIAAALARAVFDTAHVELRVGSGALANLYAFMATCRPGDAIIVPPAEIGGHVTHRDAGAAGLYGLRIHECPVNPGDFTVDLDALAELADRVRPRLITIGTSLNLIAHPVAEIRQIADRVGATVLFDAAHACGMIAGRVWPNPLRDGAHLMTMSTYKSLGGPAGGLVLTDDAELAGRLDAIAYPGLTANFDVAKTAALAITLLDWLDVGEAYARAMVDAASALATELDRLGVPVHHTAAGATTSHQLALEAQRWGGGHEASMRLRRANLLACAIGLPGGGDGAGLRLGTPEIVRIGMQPSDMAELATLIHDGLDASADVDEVAARTTAMRSRFTDVHFVRDAERVAARAPDRAWSMSRAELEEYERDGVIALPGRFGADDVAALNAALDELIDEDVAQNIREKSSGVVRTAMGLHLRHPAFERLVHDPRLLVPASQVLGGVELYVQQVKVNVKEGFTGEQWQWHYDFATHHHEDGVPEPLALNLHVFLDDVTEFNGPLMFVRGSHHDGPAPTSLDVTTTSFPLWTVGPDVVGPLAERGGLICPKGPAGTMLMFGDSILHASPPNMSPWPRRILSLIVNPVSNHARGGGRADHLHHRDLTPLPAVEHD